MTIFYFDGQSTNLSTMGRLDSQLDQQLMHTPRANCEVLTKLLVDPGVLLFNRSTLRDMALLTGNQAAQDLAIDEYKYPLNIL